MSTENFIQVPSVYNLTYYIDSNKISGCYYNSANGYTTITPSGAIAAGNMVSFYQQYLSCKPYITLTIYNTPNDQGVFAVSSLRSFLTVPNGYTSIMLYENISVVVKETASQIYELIKDASITNAKKQTIPKNKSSFFKAVDDKQSLVSSVRNEAEDAICTPCAII